MNDDVLHVRGGTKTELKRFSLFRSISLVFHLPPCLQAHLPASPAYACLCSAGAGAWFPSGNPQFDAVGEQHVNYLAFEIEVGFVSALSFDVADWQTRTVPVRSWIGRTSVRSDATD